MFDTSLLNAGRYVVIAEACLPFLLGIFLTQILGWSPGKDAGSSVRGRPPAFMFGVIWFLIAVMWFFALIVASMNFDDTHVILLGVFLFVTFIGCAMWMYYYTHGLPVTANYMLMFLVFTSFLSLVSALTNVVSLDANAPTLVSLCLVLPAVWCSIASVLGLLELK